MTRTCDICGEGSVKLKEVSTPYTYNGKHTNIAYQYQHCSFCGCEYAGKIEMQHNFKLAKEFRDKVDRK